MGWKDNPVRIESPKMGWRQPRRRLCPPRVGSLSHLIPGSTQVLSYGLVSHQVPSHLWNSVALETTGTQWSSQPSGLKYDSIIKEGMFQTMNFAGWKVRGQARKGS